MLKPFVPQLVYIEPRALEYPLGQELKNKFENMGLEIRETTSHNQVRNIPGKKSLAAIPEREINIGNRRPENTEIRFFKAVRRICHSICDGLYGALPLLLPADDDGVKALHPDICQCGRDSGSG